MFKRLIVVILFSVLFGGCALAPKKAGIEIMSTPSAKVFIDNKESGMTPYKNNSLKPGEISVKLTTAEGTEFNRKIELQNKVNTVINWEFGKSEKESGGYVLSMEKTGDIKKSSLLINATPDKSAVLIENAILGFSPTKIDDIGEGDKQITISFPGYKSSNLFIKAIKGYQLLIDSKLAQDVPLIVETPEITPSPSIREAVKVKIKTTETGWLRVRAESNNSSAEVTKVKPDEVYVLLEEKPDWYKIDLTGGKSGWVSTKYVEKLQ